MSEMSPALAGILDRLTDPATMLLGRAKALAAALADELADVKVEDTDGDDIGPLLFMIAGELAETIAELQRLHAAGDAA